MHSYNFKPTILLIVSAFEKEKDISMFVKKKFMTFITVENQIAAPIEKVWQSFTTAAHAMHWNFASDDWHCPKANNELKIGGEFHYTMAAKDNSMEFDFWGTFTQIEENKYLEMVLGDGRNMQVYFEAQGTNTMVKELFEPESQNSHELQKTGWQMILDNFKKYVEGR